MRHCLSILLWTVVFLLIVLAVDQLLVRLPASLPAHVAVADFYRDLRGRLFALVKDVKSVPAPAPARPAPAVKSKEASPASVEAVIDQRQSNPVVPAESGPTEKPVAVIKRPPAPPPAKAGASTLVSVESKPRYVYADSTGALHFADTLAEVPEEYRRKAKLLGD